MEINSRDLISKKKIRFELGESTMPKKYREFCIRVIDDEVLTPTVEIQKLNPMTVKEYTRELCGNTSYISECPECGEILNSDKRQNYCHRCGQKLEWE